MHPVLPPEELVADDCQRASITVPDEIAEHVDPVEALISRGVDGLAEINICLHVTPEDLGQMARTGELWVTFLGGVTPFRVSVDRPGEA